MRRKFYPQIVEAYFFRASPHRKVMPTHVGRERHLGTEGKNVLYVEIMLSGTAFYQGKKYERGTVFCHTYNDFTLHEFPANSPYRVLMLLFNGYQKVKWSLPHIGVWRHMEALDQFAHDALEDFHSDVERELLSQMLFSTLRLNLYVPKNTQDELIHKELYVVRKELERLDRPIVWRDFAAHAGYSPAYLRRYFKQEYKISPVQYRLRFRIETACRLLRETDLTIQEIARQTVFRNLRNFYRAFQERKGMTPQTYRKQKSSTKAPL